MSRFSIYDVACNSLWLMLPDSLEQMLAICNRETGPVDIEALSAKLGRPMDNAHRMTSRDVKGGRVAVIPISGAIFPKANLMTEVSGATSLAAVAADLDSAVKDSSIDRIVLHIDSPGGSVTGVAQMAAYIRKANATKPVLAWVEGMAASAAYWLASTATWIASDATAMVGSIGVVVTVSRDPDGKRYYREFVSPQSPKKRLDADSEAAREEYEGTAEATADVFIADVASGRGVPVARVLSDFGQGGMLVAGKARKAGMIDEIAPTFDAFLDTAMQHRAVTRSVDASAKATGDARQTEKDMNLLKLFSKPKDGETEAQAESRLNALVAAFGEGQGEFIAACHKAGHDVAAAIVAMREQHAAALDAKQKDVERLNAENTALMTAKADAEKALAAARDAEKAAQAQVKTLTAKVDDLEKRPPVNAKGGDTDTAAEDDKKVLAAFDAGTKAARR